MENSIADFLFFVGGPLLVLAVPVSVIVGAVRAKRRNASTMGIVFSALAYGFITGTIAAVLGGLGLFAMMALSGYY